MMLNTLVFAGLVLGLTQVIKLAFAVSSRFVPLVSLGIGIILFGVAYVTSDMVITWDGITQILVAVLSAMGFYSGAKATSGK